MFNAAAHFMATNPFIKIMEPTLAIGFLVHIIYAGLLTAQNRKARGGVAYASGNNTTGVSWTSKNMWILGINRFGLFGVAHCPFLGENESNRS
jgi:succinate dehydrogenase / fumarate reductase, cytochrome b subunit